MYMTVQSLATPEWAKRDWHSPAVAGTRTRRGETPGHSRGGLPTAGKSLNRGHVARKLDIEPVKLISAH